MTQPWQQYLAEHKSRFLAEFMELLRIPSLSTRPEHAGDVRQAAEWTVERMRRAGIEHVRVKETAGHPVVYGDWLHAPGKPTILFYGHYDVQPAEPLELWTSPAFEPTVRDGRLYARGASDMKGNLLLPVLATEALLQTAGALPVNVKFLFEGEEEIGSPSLPSFMMAHQQLLACDMMVSADSGQYSETEPLTIVGMRGLCSLEISVRSAATDLHSGVMGGMVPNALHALVRILDSMRGPDGEILVEGFHDEVAALTEADRALMAAYPDDRELIKAQTGIKDFFGDPRFSPRERNWVRPTLEVNGMWGGYTGEGQKTVIPCEAHAKITCRLVPNQRPEQIRQLLVNHVTKHAPPQIEVTFKHPAGSADPYQMPADHPGLKAAELALAQAYGRTPYVTRMGFTVPITAMAQKILGVDTIQLGFGQMDERQHAPDEFMRLINFERGQEVFCRFLEETAR